MEGKGLDGYWHCAKCVKCGIGFDLMRGKWPEGDTMLRYLKRTIFERNKFSIGTVIYYNGHYGIIIEDDGNEKDSYLVKWCDNKRTNYERKWKIHKEAMVIKPKYYKGCKLKDSNGIYGTVVGQSYFFGDIRVDWASNRKLFHTVKWLDNNTTIQEQ